MDTYRNLDRTQCSHFKIIISPPCQRLHKVLDLELVNSVIEELLMEVHTIIQETVNKTIPKKKKSKKAKWSSEGALQIAKGRREAKSKGETERYIHLNADFQRTALRGKKAFFNEQCKEGRKQQKGKD